MTSNKQFARHKNQTGKKQRALKKKHGQSPNGGYIWGLHAVKAALQNPKRQLNHLWLSENAQQKLAAFIPPSLKVSLVPPKKIDQMVRDKIVHQGALLDCTPLPSAPLEKMIDHKILIMLDQITDPRNIGALIRSSAAFGLRGLVMTRHKTPPINGVLAKTASGGVDLIDIFQVPNLAGSLKQLKKDGFFVLGFDSDADKTLSDFTPPDEFNPLVLVLGAEGKGLRHLTRQHCDHIVRVETTPDFPSLNVANAASICFHHFRQN